MTDRPVAFDLTRLITRLRHASPSGIDRVDLAYARWALAGAGPRFGLVTTALGPRVVDRGRAARIVDAVVAGWVEDIEAEDDPVYRRLAARLGACTAATAPHRAAASGDGLRRRRIQIETALSTLRAEGPEALPHGTLYLHTSHLRLDRPERFDWLYDRPDIRPVFFLHDLIPITHPEYGRPRESERHRLRMETVARHAAHIVVNSADVGAQVARHIADGGLPVPGITVGHLGIEPAFRPEGPRIDLDRPTFLVCGTIEPRKNHLLLLHLWRSLSQELGVGAPRLVLVGRRGWEAENIVDLLDRCAAIRDSVVEVSGLSTHGLGALMRSATALLMPSFTEGYGLPVVEAAASGLPVVASDIPVHREVGGPFAAFLDPLDGPGWRRAVAELSEPGSRRRSELSAGLIGYAPPTWTGHFQRVEAALGTLRR
ncbi:glycosyltransferase family 4 protein [Methylobacterium oxalidis]|uniref:Capsular polysaccharide glycosyltransferase biosynthesis protein n=1 Tax=Methylobacterium oxalidis TaxID=944322 RepID=A0A512J8L6_9HYPH|nr:glycosyltransferase family 1 protein [Methylobacterium oxalidis]GEP06306.1 capsular polysaccharide glycosyltransferase biosynthesis protein [Methylobacterium oxalidis]GJE30907.1 D-inositol-3-phosphate glycosyltransferase [Methylobacterium oxalidis]GLS64355.1 glycosyl transferase [Methylobacterium oxalidis]